MHITQLMASIQEEFKVLFQAEKFKAKNKELQPIKIKQGWYVKKMKSEDFPYILISPDTEMSDYDADTIKLLFIIGTYSEEEDGWLETLHIAEKIKLYLKERNTIADRYEIVKNDPNKKIKTEFPDQQPYPQWFCFIEVYFNVFNPSDISINYGE